MLSTKALFPPDNWFNEDKSYNNSEGVEILFLQAQQHCLDNEINSK